jgi:hypothetical protein
LVLYQLTCTHSQGGPLMATQWLATTSAEQHHLRLLIKNCMTGNSW